MKKKPDRPPEPDATALRRLAEERMSGSRATPDPAPTGTDMVRLIHELQVHQIELEMQNEELQRTRDRLKAGLEKYSDLYDFAPVGYLTLDRAGTIQEANLAAASLLGTERSRLVHQRFGVHVAPKDLADFNALLEKVFANQVRGFCELTLAHGHPSPFAVRIEAAMGASGRECRVVLVDFTGRKRAEEDRLTLNKLESTGILAGGIAHDFNNLLTVILLDIELAQALSPSDEESARLLAQARKAALSARVLTQQLISFAKGGTPVRKPTRLPAIIHDSVRLPLSGSRARCEVSLAEDLWLADVDEAQIGQVIRNLVLNAREAMPEGGLIFVRATNMELGPEEPFPTVPAGDYVRISVTDVGPGMPEKVRMKIFDPYFSTKQRGDEKGTGLGLTICHAIVQKHGGVITVTSEVGVGTTFHVDLPAAREGRGEIPVATESKDAPPARILVMDDEEAVRKVIGISLRRMGHEVDLVADGRRAIDLFRNAKDKGCPFDLVLLDLTVRAGLGGQEAFKAMHELDPNVKAIVMSGYVQESATREAELDGFVGVLAKPFEIERLQEVVARVTRKEPVRKAAS